MIKKGQIREIPARTDNDPFILDLAGEFDAWILSNDLFKEYSRNYSQVIKRRIPFMVLEDRPFIYDFPVEEDDSKWMKITISGDIPDFDEGLPKQRIELDYPPFSTRPYDLIDGIIEGTGLPKRIVPCFCGASVWDYDDIPPAIWNLARPMIRKRISKLFEDGIIRYGNCT